MRSRGPGTSTAESTKGAAWKRGARGATALALALLTLGLLAPRAPGEGAAPPAAADEPPAATSPEAPAGAPGDAAPPAANAPSPTPADRPAAAPAPAAAATVAVIPIHGEIDGVLSRTFARRLELALAAKPRYIVLDMDTWGGELHAAFEIAHRVRRIDDSVRTIAYISEKAISAGALISLACDAIAMRPGTLLGDCEAIFVSDGEIKTAPEKIKTTLRATFRDFAEKNGYPADLAVAMVDKDHEVVKVALAPEGADLTTDEGREAAQAAAEVVYVQRSKLDDWPLEKRDRIVREETAVKEGELLTMNHTEARDLGFCRWVVDDLDGVYAALEAESGLTLQKDTYVETPWESFIAFLTSGPMRSLLMFVGVLGLMVEFYNPGLIFPGLVGLICLGIAFFSGHLIGMVNVVDVALIVIGIALLLVEVFVIPGFGVTGILGLVSLLAGCFLSLQAYTWPTTSWEVASFQGDLERFFLGIVATGIVFALTLRFLPKSPFLRHLVLADTQKPEDGYTVGSPSRVALIGRRGVTATALRPAGKVEVADQLLDAVSEGGFIDQGTEVVVLVTDANRVVVRAAGEEATA